MDIVGNEKTPGSDHSDFDIRRGDDSWIGRELRKKFWTGKGKNRKHATFVGKVTNVDDDADHPGKRLFEVRYDDGDVEWLDAEEINHILIPVANVEEISESEEGVVGPPERQTLFGSRSGGVDTAAAVSATEAAVASATKQQVI